MDMWGENLAIGNSCVLIDSEHGCRGDGGGKIHRTVLAMEWQGQGSLCMQLSPLNHHEEGIEKGSRPKTP